MKVYAVIDTNVIVSAILSKKHDSATVRVLELLMENKFIPVFNEEIINEYKDVLYRKKFKFPTQKISKVLNKINENGFQVERTSSKEIFLDPSDAVFYEVALSKEGSFVVTGNLKHFPKSPIIVTPSEILKIINK